MGINLKEFTMFCLGLVSFFADFSTEMILGVHLIHLLV